MRLKTKVLAEKSKAFFMQTFHSFLAKINSINFIIMTDSLMFPILLHIIIDARFFLMTKAKEKTTDLNESV